MVLGMRSAPALAFGALALASGAALADQRCRDVKIEITNHYRDGLNTVAIVPLKVFYYDYEDARWRSENIPNKKINYGFSDSTYQTLEYVGNEPVPLMQVRFKFIENKGKSKTLCSNMMWMDTRDCHAGKVYPITVAGLENCARKVSPFTLNGPPAEYKGPPVN